MNNYQAATNNINIPIFQCHGKEDPVVPYVWGKKTSDIINQFSTKSEFNSYEGLMHRVNEKVSDNAFCRS